MVDAWIVAGMSGAAGAVGAAVRRAAETARIATAQRDVRFTTAAIAGALTAGLSAILTLRVDGRPELIAYVYLAAVGVSLATIDMLEQRLPDALTLPSYVVIATLITLEATARSDIAPAVRATLGMATVIVLYLAVAVLSRGGLGAGDVKLGGLLGLTLAWQSWTTLLVGVALGWALASTALLPHLATPRRRVESTVPLGPFLLAGAFVSVLLPN